MSGSAMKAKDAKTLHFFRIILGQNQKLEVPKRFVSIYGNDLSNSVILKAPNGKEWRVELIKCDGEVWLGNGWKDFADYFSLKYGNLLIFRYKGHSRFYVLMIFDQTTFEIEYPINNSSIKDGNHDAELRIPKVEEETQSDVSVEIVDDISRCQKKPDKTPLASFSRCKRMRTSMSSGIQGTWKVKKSGGSPGESKFKMSRKRGSKIGIQHAKEAGRGTSTAVRIRPINKAPSRMESLTNKRNAGASSRASNFESGNPFFVVDVKQSYIRRHDLHIPLAFARTYLTWKEADVILRDSEGRTWSVHFKVYKKNHIAHFGRGWKAFALDNDLQEGDACAFELLEGLEMSFRVTIFRVAGDSNNHLTAAHGSKIGHVRRKREMNTRSRFQCDYISEDEVNTSRQITKESHVPRRKIETEHGKFKQVMQHDTGAWRTIRRLSSKGAARALERASKLRSYHPFFTVVITANFLRNGCPSVPGRFCEEYLTVIPEDVTLKFKGKSWFVRMSSCLDREGRFSGGWRAFAWGNKLEVGDVCVFKMIMMKKANVVFEVSIFRGNQSLG